MKEAVNVICRYGGRIKINEKELRNVKVATEASANTATL